MTSPFGALQALREKPLPPWQPLMDKRHGYRSWPLSLDDSRNQEPLVKASDFGLAGETFYHSVHNPPYYTSVPGAPPWPYLRRGIIDRLLDIQNRLAEAGLELWIYDGWRPTAVQAFFYHTWMPAEVRRRHPDFSGARVMEEVGDYWARPADGPLSPSPHLTGGALDCELRWKNSKRPLWFGSIFDDATALSHTPHFEADRQVMAFSDEEARANRRLLYWLMTGAGFVNNPTEWWHFSYGDQMWAKFRDEPFAFYGAVSLP
ncbi:MAG: peptidase M15D vanX D-ala-D-ala dipeptidase [Pseudomonadota bacterium]|nr:peptidase M15D vanX D-ala-D-ala dipeptidase [Pseudomonadota bacterium]